MMLRLEVYPEEGAFKNHSRPDLGGLLHVGTVGGKVMLVYHRN